MARIIKIDGRQISVPDDATPDDIEGILAAAPAGAAGAPASAPADLSLAAVPSPALSAPPPAAPAPQGGNSWIDAIMGGANRALGTAAVGLQEARHGAGSLLGAPVDLVNAVLNTVGLGTSRPLGGSQDVNRVSDLPTAALSAVTGQRAEVKPDGVVDRVVGRIGQEIGATAVPVGMALRAARSLTPEVVRQASGSVGQNLKNFFMEPAVVAPGNLAVKEAGYAGAAGAGAGIANEVVGNPQTGDNFKSDFIGSLLGVLGGATLNKVAGTVGNTLGHVTGRPGLMDDVAGQEVADRIINNSSDLARQFQDTGKVDSSTLARKLRTAAPIEEIVPGYQANIGDRAQDPQIMSMVYNQDAVTPGAATVRRTANEAAVNDKMAAVAPSGDPAQFRAALEADRQAKIGAATSSADIARIAFEDAAQGVQPGMREAGARGAQIRSALADVYQREQNRVRGLYEPINNSTQTVDITPLRDQFQQIDQTLPVNDRQRFRPTEANVPAQLVPDEAAAPVPTGLLDAQGNPIVRPAPAPDPNVPLAEVGAIRAGLTDNTRMARANGPAREAHVNDQYRQAVDQFTEQAVPPELQGQFDAARAARRDVAERFERPGEGVAETLRTREGGGYRDPDNAIPSRFAQPDKGNLTDLRSLLREAGQDPRARDGLADEVLSDVQRRGLVDKPEQLTNYLRDRSVLLGEFPELRTRLEQAGAARGSLTQAERTAAETEARLTKPGRSAQANYLQYGDEATVDAVRNLTSSKDPRAAARELLDAAGNTPEARVNARSALWEAVKTKKLPAQGVTGNDRWDAKKLKGFFDDPKTSAVADELWSDNPQELAHIKEFFGALAGAEGSTRARAPNTSGTAQALSGKFDPSLSASSIASRVRSVNRGQLSPGIAAIDIAGTWLRNRSKQAQSRAIDTLASAAFNNPGLAADLLEKFNPADYAAKRRMLTQKYGVRATQVVNLLDEMQNDDPVKNAVMGEDK